MAYSYVSYVGAKNSQGQPHGQGTAIDANGYTHIGQWRNGLRHGFGTQQFWSGTSHTGEYRNGVLHGQVIETNQDQENGYTNVGNNIEGKRHGLFVMTYSDGRVFEIVFNMDKELSRVQRVQNL